MALAVKNNFDNFFVIKQYYFSDLFKSNQQQIIKILNMHFEDRSDKNVQKRRYSMLDRLPDVKQLSQREQIKSKYREFIQSRIKSFQQYPHSPESKTLSKTQQIEFSMPSIRKIRQQRDILKETLRQTLTRYNYAEHEKQKKLQYLNRKKMKYEKVLQIRQQHNKQKMKLNQSRLSFLKQINDEKLKLKKTVDSEKLSVDESKTKVINEKKLQGNQRRQEQHKNKSRILENRSKQFEVNKKLHSSVALQQQRLKMKKKIMERKQRRINTQNYYNRLTKEIVTFNEIQDQQVKTKREISPKIQKAQKAKQKIEEQLKNYQDFLKEGSTLKKFKPKIKKNFPNKKQINSQLRFKMHSMTDSSGSFY